jgi:hypothetical protein
MSTKYVHSFGVVLAVCLALLGVVTAPAYAEEGERCGSASGSIKVSPALSESPHVVQLTFRDLVSQCTGMFREAK